MKKIKKIIALVITVIICLSLCTACGGSNTPSSSPPVTSGSNPPASPSPSQKSDDVAGREEAPIGENIRFAEKIDIVIDNMSVAVLNPFAPGGSFPAIMWSYNLMYDRLLRFAGGSEYEPSLATEWTTDDYITFTLKLRDDIYFQNGEKFTANDVVFTAKLSKDSAGSPSNVIWAPVKEVTAIDEYTVQFVMNNVTVNFWYNLARPEAVICNEKAVNADSEKGPWVGTGAYCLTEFTANNYWVFERNDNYWGEPPITKTLTMRYLPEINTRAISLLNGECQICFKISNEDMDLFENNPDYVIFDHELNNPSPLYFNMTDPLCADYNFRMAVISALNREEISLAVAGNYTRPAYDDGGVWGNFQEFRNRDIPMVPEDLEAAKAYLEASPYNGEVVEIAAANAMNIKAAEIVQQQLDQIGLKTEINIMDGTALSAYVAWGNNKSQIVSVGMQLYLEASSFNNLVYPERAQNRSSYSNPIITDLVDRATKELDYAKREELYKEIQSILAEDPPFVNLFWILQTVVGVKGIGGFNLPADSFYDLRYIYLQLED